MLPIIVQAYMYMYMFTCIHACVCFIFYTMYNVHVHCTLYVYLLSHITEKLESSIQLPGSGASIMSVQFDHLVILHVYMYSN